MFVLWKGDKFVSVYSILLDDIELHEVPDVWYVLLDFLFDILGCKLWFSVVGLAASHKILLLHQSIDEEVSETGCLFVTVVVERVALSELR